MIFFKHFAHPPEWFFTYSQAETFSTPGTESSHPPVDHQRNQWRFPAMARDSSGTNPSQNYQENRYIYYPVSAAWGNEGPSYFQKVKLNNLYVKVVCSEFSC